MLEFEAVPPNDDFIDLLHLLDRRLENARQSLKRACEHAAAPKRRSTAPRKLREALRTAAGHAECLAISARQWLKDNPE